VTLLKIESIGLPETESASRSNRSPARPATERLIRVLCVALGAVAILVGASISTPTERERLVWLAAGAAAGIEFLKILPKTFA
jgi:hypothetical protein